MREILAAVFVVCSASILPAAAPVPRSAEYAAIQSRLARGWNSWDTHSVAAQVLLPEAFTVRIQLRPQGTLYDGPAHLDNALIGRFGNDAETVTPGPHTWDGRYSELTIAWHGNQFRLQTATDGDDLVMLATPLKTSGVLPPSLIVSTGILWNRAGTVSHVGGHIVFSNATRRVPLYWTGGTSELSAGALATPYFAAGFSQPIGVSSGRPRTLAEIRGLLTRARPATGDTRQAIETVIGWDTIYEPTRDRVISPVSRIWNLNWGGYVLFDWDTFFAGALAATGSRDLAYANAVEVLREATTRGFVPNYARPGDWKSFDRSEPPVGAITVLALYRRFQDRWFVRDTFEGLLAWNRWWSQARDLDGYLVWGSDPDTEVVNPSDKDVGTKQGAVYESGLDNSPMYDDAPFDPAVHKLRYADVGLMGLYVADCNALAELADVLGRVGEGRELRERSARYGARLQTLWDERSGMFLNRNLVTGESSHRLSPTNFYPMLAHVATPTQARRMVAEHLLNPQEFWGEWVIPAIARNDPAYKDQNYWRGRIWGPMNYLVYLGLRQYGEPEARRQLAERSLALFQKEWREHGHVHENYNAITGSGDDVTSSDRFYHWGALLALISLEEQPPAR